MRLTKGKKRSGMRAMTTAVALECLKGQAHGGISINRRNRRGAEESEPKEGVSAEGAEK